MITSGEIQRSLTRAHAKELVREASATGRSTGTLAGIPARLVWDADEAGGVTLSVAISVLPVKGERSGLPFPLTQARFLLASEAVRQAAEDLYKPEVLAEEIFEFPGGLNNERAFVLVFEPTT